MDAAAVKIIAQVSTSASAKFAIPFTREIAKLDTDANTFFPTFSIDFPALTNAPPTFFKPSPTHDAALLTKPPIDFAAPVTAPHAFWKIFLSSFLELVLAATATAPVSAPVAGALTDCSIFLYFSDAFKMDSLNTLV